MNLWQDFVHRSTGALPAAASQATASGSIWVRIQQPEPRSKNIVETPPPDDDAGSRGQVKQRCTATRLTFKQDVIEPLAEDDAFEVVTRSGHRVCNFWPDLQLGGSIFHRTSDSGAMNSKDFGRLPVRHQRPARRWINQKWLDH